MGHNIEIKARVGDPVAMRRLVASIAERGPEILHQEDLFFPCRDGRLKLRTFAPDRGELIHYRRPDGPEPEESDYLIAPTAEPGRLGGLLSRALGSRGVVRKVRTVYHVGATRIHLDEVEGLGSFIELETVLSPGRSRDDGRREASRLMDRLGIGPDDLVAKAYIDLLG
jgi:adenylate cyclase